MLFAFVACDGGSQGPTGGDVTESEAKTFAGNYLGSINFSQLIVDAFDDTVTTIGVPSLSKEGFIIELDKYEGKAFTKTTVTTPEKKAAATDDSATNIDDTESEEGKSVTITGITSGTIEFTFTTANSKTTYTAKTADDDPIVFTGAPEGAELAFDITGEATITFNRVGTNGAISNLASESTVKIGAPDATKSTISVGGTSVDYGDIKESAKNGFDKTATATDEEEDGEEIVFTAQDAQNAIIEIVNSISKNKLASDIAAGGNETTLKVALNITRDGVDCTEEFEALGGSEETSLLTGDDNSSKLLPDLMFNPDKFVLNYTLDFNDYKNGFDSTKGDAESVTGKVSLVINLGTTDTQKILGTYTVSTENPVVVTMTDDTVYNVSISAFSGQVSFVMGEDSNGYEFLAPAKDEAATITISKKENSATSASQDIKWSTIATEDKLPGSKFSEGIAKELDAKYFYQHFGTKRFLNAISGVFNPDATKAEETPALSFAKESITIKDEDSEKSFTIDLKLNDYIYYRGDSNQRVSGNVKITFTGTVDSENKTFTATAFTVNTTKALDLSDASSANKRIDATIAFKDVKGTIGDDTAQDKGSFNESNQHVTFTINDSNTNTISGIAEYTYNQYCNEFVFTDGFDNSGITFTPSTT